MSIKNLEFLFKPRRIAVIGASDDQKTVGYRAFRNLIGKGFKGAVYPVNSRLEAVQGVEAYAKITAIPRDIDLALLAVPPEDILTVLDECGQKDVKTVVIFCPDYSYHVKNLEELDQKIRQISSTYEMRTLGPDSIGFIRPGSMLNASLFPEMPPKGNIAFISQSATLSAALLDRAVSKNVGLSCFVSVGARLDVDTTDLIDYLAMDPETWAIVLYLDNIAKGRKFMASVRSFASTKPIVVIKAGKLEPFAHGESSPLALFIAEDKVYDAAFKRAGAIRVDEILDLFYLTETLAKQSRPKGNRLAVVSNSGGPSIIAVDALITMGGRLAKFNEETQEQLKKELPMLRSVQNPLDLLSGSSPQQFDTAVRTCLKDTGVDGLLVIYTPSLGPDPRDVARAVVTAAKAYHYKPVFTSWMGEDTVISARELLNESGIPTFVTTEQAVKSFIYTYRYDHNLKLLRETPLAILKDFTPEKEKAVAVMKNAIGEGRFVLTLRDAKEVLTAYGIPVITTHSASDEHEAVSVSEAIGYPVVMKLDAPVLPYRCKRDEGTIYKVKDGPSARKAYRRLKDLAESCGHAQANVLIQPMVGTHGFELAIGMKKNGTFGAAIAFGLGGDLLNVERDYSVALPPLNQALARQMMGETAIYRYLESQEAYHHSLRRLEEVMVRFSQLVIDSPFIKEVDINSFFLTQREGFVLNCRILLEEDALVSLTIPREDLCPIHLSICPYPDRYVKELALRDGTPVVIRPIRPEDEPLIGEFMKGLSGETFSFRFCQQVVEMSHERLVRYCQVDYDRELAFVAVMRGSDGRERIIGDVRVIKQPDLENAEVAILVSDEIQGKGLGRILMEYCLRVSKEVGLKALWMEILKENTRMLHIAKLFDFKRAYADEDMIKVALEI